MFGRVYIDVKISCVEPQHTLVVEILADAGWISNCAFVVSISLSVGVLVIIGVGTVAPVGHGKRQKKNDTWRCSNSTEL